MNKNYLLYWVIVVTLVVGLTIPILIQDGMFMDAVQYSAVAHNLSQGIGTFWALQFDLHNIHELPAFSEQPPLAFGIQSLLYRLLGGSMYVERLYTFICLFIHILLIIQLWNSGLNSNKEFRLYAWLPLLFWILTPIVFWSFRNNMLENTMGIFILISAIFTYKSLLTGNNILLFLGGFFLFLASFTKGMPGLFPLAMPVLYAVIFRNIEYKKAVLQTSVLVLPLVICYLLMLLMPASKEFYERYFIHRTLERIETDPTVSSRLFILGAFSLQVFPMLGVTLFFLIINKTKAGIHISAEFVKTGMFFIAVGLCGVLPLMITTIQKAFYLTPAFPFVALGFGVLCIPVCTYYLEKLKNNTSFYRTLSGITLAFVTLTIIICVQSLGGTSRNEKLLGDVRKIGKTIPEHTTIASSTNTYYNWNLHSYIIRYYNIRLDYANEYKYLLLDNEYDNEPGSNYVKLDVGLEDFRLYKRL